MKIAYFSDTFCPQINGVVTSIINSSRILAEKGHKICIFTIKDKDKGCDLKLHKNIKVIRYSSIDAFKYPGFELVVPDTLQCFKEVKKFNPDIIHIHTPTLLGWEGVICGKVLKVPVVGTYHTLVPDFLKHSPIPKLGDYEITKKIAWKYTNKFYEKCDVVTTPSEAMKKELIKNGLKGKIEVVSNGVDLSLFHKRKRKSDRFKILYLGRISYEKNIDVVMKAVAEFAKKNRGFEFLVVGLGPDLENMKSLAEKLEILKFVRFPGPAKNIETPEIYSNSNIFVTASTIETEGIVILEAMACGLPIIGVNARAIPDLIKNEKNGFVVNPGDYYSMAKHISEICNDKRLGVKIGKNNMKEVKNYEIKKSVSKMLRIYSGIPKKI